MIHLLLITLLMTSPHLYEGAARDFETREECQQVRGVLVAQALAQSAKMWLISSCELAEEPVVLRVFMAEPTVPTAPEVQPDT